MYLAPAYIATVFKRFEPLPPGRERRYRRVCQLHKVQLSGIFTLDGSKRSTKSNAFFAGFGKHRRLVLFRYSRREPNDSVTSIRNRARSWLYEENTF
jgi:STE24 endopeptidase